jgi:hypothetical protein
MKPVATLSNGQPIAHRIIDVRGQRWRPFAPRCDGYETRAWNYVYPHALAFHPYLYPWTTPPSKPLRRLWYVYSAMLTHEPIPTGEVLVFQYEVTF